MKRPLQKILSLALSFVILFQLSATAWAAPSRKPATVKYLSAVALIEAKDDAEADKILTELKKTENGAYEDYIKQDLNKGGEKKIYLAYKTSTNVDDAITDLSVMNMNGDYYMGSYEQLLTETLDQYILIAKDYRTMAAEFKKNYDAGYPNAITAHRQMNYYYVEEAGVKTYMGDYLLNFPADDMPFAEMLFNGNLQIIANLRMLMAMGIGDTQTLLSKRIQASYQKAQADESIYSEAVYEDAAKELKAQLDDMKDKINQIPDKLKDLANGEIEEDIKTSLTTVYQQSLDNATTFYELLKKIPMGDTNLGDFVLDSPVVTPQDLFPVVAAATPGEALMMEYHGFYDLLLYSEISLGGAAMDEALTELEKNYTPLSVYHGVQNDLLEGTIGVTGDAQFLSASTGKGWLSNYQYNNATRSAFLIMGIGGTALTAVGAAYLYTTHTAQSAVYANLQKAFTEASNKLTNYGAGMLDSLDAYTGYVHNSGMVLPTGGSLADFLDDAPQYLDDLSVVQREVDVAGAKLANVTNGLSGGQMVLGGLVMAMGLVMMGVSIWQLVELGNRYQGNYTAIPDNMVHVASDSVHGDRFVNYNNAPSYYYEVGGLQTRQSDMNAYAGKEWISLYYTKNSEAGYCLTASADLIATESVRDGYAGVHRFGHDANYNLNSHCNRENAEAVYLAFKYSANEKSADADVPDVISTSFSTGTLAIVGFSGLVIGMAIMGVVMKVKAGDKKPTTKGKEEKL